MITILQGDCRDVLSTLAPGSVQMCMTSPPYYGLRKYSDDPREIGQEAIPDCLAWAAHLPPCGQCYVCALRAVFAGVWRALRDDGVLFLNLADSYYSAGGGQNAPGGIVGQPGMRNGTPIRPPKMDIPEKNLLGIPWRVALALQSDGWVLRSDIIWSKSNPMPESVQDRPTRSHEYVFLFAKQQRYYYDAAAVAEPATVESNGSSFTKGKTHDVRAHLAAVGQGERIERATRNRRTVWNINTTRFSGSHYAVFPEALADIPIRAGSAAQACEHCGAAWRRVVERENNWQERKANGAWAGNVGVADNYQNNVHGNGMSHDLGGGAVRDLGFAPGCQCSDNTGSAASVVLDPFAGSGTVGRVAERLGRNAILCELSQDYIDTHIEARLDGVQREMAL